MLPANECLGQQYNVIAEFCADLSLCPRGHSLVVSDRRQRVFCFSERPDAEKFRRGLAGCGSIPLAIFGRNVATTLMTRHGVSIVLVARVLDGLAGVLLVGLGLRELIR